jgi:hypothetical protein
MNQTSRTIYSLCSAHLINKLFFYSSSAHLVHEPNSQVNYRIEFRTIHELARVIVSPNSKPKHMICKIHKTRGHRNKNRTIHE